MNSMVALGGAVTLGDPWNPWRALREQPHIELRFAYLGGRRGLWQRDELGDVIVLDAELGRRSRRSVLAHELVHAERGIGFGAASARTMAREEESTRREVARRLVPRAALVAFVNARLPVGECVASIDLEAEFDVDPDVACKAVDLLGWRVQRSRVFTTDVPQVHTSTALRRGPTRPLSASQGLLVGAWHLQRARLVIGEVPQADESDVNRPMTLKPAARRGVGYARDWISRCLRSAPAGARQATTRAAERGGPECPP